MQASVSGTVTDTGALPVAQASVQFTCSYRQIVLPNATTDERGQFQALFSVYKGKTYQISLRVDKKYYTSISYSSKITLSVSNSYSYAVPAGELELNYIAQSVRGQVSGNLLMYDNSVAASISVQLVLAPPAKISQNPLTSDEQGRFRFEFDGYDTETYRAYLQILQQDYEPSSNVTLQLDRNNGFEVDFKDFILKRRPLRGMVYGAVLAQKDNSSISGAMVQIAAAPFIAIDDAFTDAQGRFQSTFQIEAGVYYTINVIISAKFFAPLELKGLTLNRENLYSINLQQVYLPRINKTAKIAGYCVLRDNAAQRVTEGAVTVSSITPNISGIEAYLRDAKCSPATGDFLLEFPVENGLEYTGWIFYTDGQQRYNDHAQYFALDQLSLYTILDYRLIISKPISLLLQGTVRSTKLTPISGAAATLSFLDLRYKDLLSASDLKGEFSLSAVIFSERQSIAASLKIEHQSNALLSFLLGRPVRAQFSFPWGGCSCDAKPGRECTYTHSMQHAARTHVHTHAAHSTHARIAPQSRPAGPLTDLRARASRCTDYQTLERRLVFDQSNQFSFLNQNYELGSSQYLSSVSGRVVDEFSQPVSFSRISLELYNHAKQLQAQQEIQTGVGGEFLFQLQLSHDYSYVCYVAVAAADFAESAFRIQLNSSNNYQAEHVQLPLARLPAQLELRFRPVNGAGETLQLSQAKLLFADSSRETGARDILDSNRRKNGVYVISAQVKQGLSYNGTLALECASYES